MPQFILKIDLGNDGLSFPNDVAESLRIVANHIQHEGATIRGNGKLLETIRDINGNVVGNYEVVDS